MCVLAYPNLPQTIPNSYSVCFFILLGLDFNFCIELSIERFILSSKGVNNRKGFQVYDSRVGIRMFVAVLGMALVWLAPCARL